MRPDRCLDVEFQTDVKELQCDVNVTERQSYPMPVHKSDAGWLIRGVARDIQASEVSAFVARPCWLTGSRFSGSSPKTIFT